MWVDDQARFAVMQQIISDLERLTVEQRAQFVDLAQDTRYERDAAERALTRWQEQTLWTSQYCMTCFPKAATLLEELLASHRPTEFPYVARTAAIDAARCAMLTDLQPPIPDGICKILCGPVEDVLNRLVVEPHLPL